MTRKAPAKINAFLKVTGTRGNYHEIISRFIALPDLHDTLTLAEDSAISTFTIEGDFNCTTEQNTIYKVYQALLKAYPSQKLADFFKNHKVVVDKKIPSFAGLGGGSSDAATFLMLCNDVAGLKISKDQLAQVGAQVGADIPFFIYEYPQANVSGIGEIVAPFEEEALSFETFTPPIECDTVAVFQNYRRKFFAPIDAKEAQKLAQTPTKELLEQLSISEANDLFNPACDLYEGLKAHATKGRFFSGSGSTFFSLKEPRHG